MALIEEAPKKITSDLLRAETRVIEFDAEMFAAMFRQGARVNRFISKGLPEDALLIEAHLDLQHDVLMTTWLATNWPDGAPGWTFCADEIAFFCEHCQDWPTETVLVTP